MPLHVVLNIVGDSLGFAFSWPKLTKMQTRTTFNYKSVIAKYQVSFGSEDPYSECGSGSRGMK